MPPAHPGRWTVIVPLKGGPHAKSRLQAPESLSRAIALDCLAAVLATPSVARVLVVTPDGGLAAEAASRGAHVVGEPAPGGLNDAVTAGVRLAEGATAVLLGDLPALRPGDLDAALAAHRAAGAVELPLDLPRLRRDVDTPADLDAAARLGLGPRTAAVLGAR